MRKRRVFVDTNAIFPAIEAGEWKRLCGHFSVETVVAVVDETQKGNVNRKGYVRVERSMLEQSLTKIHRPSDEDRAAFRLKALELKIELDDGERDLLAYLQAYEKLGADVLVLTTSDRAAVRACCHLGWGDALISLDRLLTEAGAPPSALKSLASHQREPWLSEVRTNFRLGLVK
jgi:hypothetical protein